MLVLWHSMAGLALQAVNARRDGLAVPLASTAVHQGAVRAAIEAVKLEVLVAVSRFRSRHGGFMPM